MLYSLPKREYIVLSGNFSGLWKAEDLFVSDLQNPKTINLFAGNGPVAKRAAPYVVTKRMPGTACIELTVPDERGYRGQQLCWSLLYFQCDVIDAAGSRLRIQDASTVFCAIRARPFRDF